MVATAARGPGTQRPGAPTRAWSLASLLLLSMSNTSHTQQEGSSLSSWRCALTISRAFRSTSIATLYRRQKSARLRSHTPSLLAGAHEVASAHNGTDGAYANSEHGSKLFCHGLLLCCMLASCNCRVRGGADRLTHWSPHSITHGSTALGCGALWRRSGAKRVRLSLSTSLYSTSAVRSNGCGRLYTR